MREYDGRPACGSARLRAPKSSGRARCVAIGLPVAALSGLLMIPEAAPPPPPPAPPPPQPQLPALASAVERPDHANQDEVWLALE